ncbi:MAG: EamA family transporter [Lachnospiraceae bacterium]|nr:EamA family transporter [Candidatus Colinaster equi]
MWVLLVLFYGVAKGFRDVIKKKALTKNTVMEVLFVYTFIAFVMCVPDARNAMGVPIHYYFLIAIKSFIIFVAWICSFKALDNIPISVYGVVDLSRMVFTTFFGVLVLGEQLTKNGLIGLIIVIIGLLILKQYPVTVARIKGKPVAVNEDIKTRYVVMALVSCICNAMSGCLDKIYMRDLNSSQLQFWYMFFLTVFYALYFVIKRVKINPSVWKNGWIWGMSILFFLADRALFIANSYKESKVTIMTLLKQSACIVTILSGKFIFKEKNVGYKLVCAGVVVAGIVIACM